MRFGRVPLDRAEGLILAHAVRLPDGRLPKGTLLSPQDLARLRDAGVDAVVGATLDGGDWTENAAAAAVATALSNENLIAEAAATGRANLHAATSGVLVVDRERVDALNAIDPAITLATLPAFASVRTGQMVATVKIIPLAVSGASIERAGRVLAEGATLRVAPFRPRRVVLVQTRLPSVKESVLDKTARILAGRLEASGSAITVERRCVHAADDLTVALATLPEAELVVVFGASAVIDAADVIPAAIEDAGGRVDQLGMPVDPGNLLLLGRFRGQPILGAPGCARSPKENGFDWVLDRILADVPATSADIRRMGVGGLLGEIPSRPHPRQAAAKDGA